LGKKVGFRVKCWRNGHRFFCHEIIAAENIGSIASAILIGGFRPPQLSKVKSTEQLCTKVTTYRMKQRCSALDIAATIAELGPKLQGLRLANSKEE
jgi:hypothetical protein